MVERETSLLFACCSQGAALKDSDSTQSSRGSCVVFLSVPRPRRLHYTQVTIVQSSPDLDDGDHAQPISRGIATVQ